MSVNNDQLQALIYRIRELIQEIKRDNDVEEQLLETQKRILEVQLQILNELKK